MSTHLGNGAGDTLSRRANYIWEQLAEDRLAAGFIVDGVHLDTAFLKVALRAKGVDRSVLVTDAAAPAGCAPGRYRLGLLDVVLTEEQCIMLADRSRLAASALSMDRAIGNLVSLAGLSLREAVAMATVNPARVGRIAGRQRGLVAGRPRRHRTISFRPGVEDDQDRESDRGRTRAASRAHLSVSPTPGLHVSPIASDRPSVGRFAPKAIFTLTCNTPATMPGAAPA